MGERPAQHSSVPFAFRAWLVALAVFLVWLGVTLSAGPHSPAAPVAHAPGKGTPQADDPGVILTDLPVVDVLATPDATFAPEREHVLVGFGLQGLYQTTGEEQAWTLSAPGNTLAAQLVQRGPGPRIVTENVRIFWEISPDTRLADAGTDKEKDTPASRKGEMTLAADGLSFTALIPVLARQSDGMLNPYPVISLTAEDSADGTVIARTAAVLAVSPGYGCAHCHADGGKAILEVHDRHQGTDLLARADKKETVDCRACHSALTGEERDAAPERPGSVSAAVHGWHAPYLAGRAADACLTCHIGLGRSAGEDDSQARPLFLRDMHRERGLQCVNCHGPMEDHALALLAAEKKAKPAPAGAAMALITPRLVPSADDITPRLPWTQEPDCTGCHDFSTKPDATTASAFNLWTEETAGLFSRRLENMAALRCGTCHGAPHALYPAQNPVSRDRDNIAPLQYQQHARPLGGGGNCASCHNEAMDYSAHHDLVEPVSRAE